MHLTFYCLFGTKVRATKTSKINATFLLKNQTETYFVKASLVNATRGSAEQAELRFLVTIQNGGLTQCQLAVRNNVLSHRQTHHIE